MITTSQLKGLSNLGHSIAEDRLVHAKTALLFLGPGDDCVSSSVLCPA